MLDTKSQLFEICKKSKMLIYSPINTMVDDDYYKQYQHINEEYNIIILFFQLIRCIY